MQSNCSELDYSTHPMSRAGLDNRYFGVFARGRCDEIQADCTMLTREAHRSLLLREPAGHWRASRAGRRSISGRTLAVIR